MPTGIYANGLRALMNKEVDLDTDTIKCSLHTSSYSPNLGTHDYKDDLTNEVTGTGYTAGGATVTSPTITVTVANSWSAQWTAATAYQVGQVVRPTAGNGFLYLCTVAGTSHASTQPTWPTTRGATVVDNGATWLCVGQAAVTFTATIPTWASSTITARQAVFYRDSGVASTSQLIACLDFGSDKSSSSGNFQVTLSAEGALTIFV